MTRCIIENLREGLQEPPNKIDGGGDVGQVDPQDKNAAVAGVVVKDGVDRTSLLDQVWLDGLNLLQRRLMLRIRGANLAALHMVAFRVNVNQQ